MLPKIKLQWNVFARLLLIGILITKVSAGTLGVFTYEINGGTEVEINRCDINATGVITVPDEIEGLPVTEIDFGAFLGCTQMTSVILPGTVTEIQRHAFIDCTSLTSIEIPEGVTAIQARTFGDCTSLTNVTLPTSLERIDTAAFISCTALTGINLPPNLHTLEREVFRHCSGLTNITLPGSITSMGINIFENCTGLTSAVVSAGITELPSELFENCSSLTNVSLPGGLLEIDSDCFYRCYSLVNISIPASVTTLHDYAFRSCSSLININVDIANTTYTSLNGVVFNDDLTELIICPNGRTGSYAIPTGGTHIANQAFNRCRKLTEIIIPETVTNLSSFSFRECSSLVAINVDTSNTVYTSDDGVVYNLNRTELIVCPGGKPGTYTVPNGVVTIDSRAFYDCRKISQVILPEGITVIRFSTFEYCFELEKINLPPGLTTIEERAFRGCRMLTHIVFPETLVEIEDLAFQYTSILTKAYFLGDAPLLGNFVFQDRFGSLKTTIYYLSSKTGFTSPTWNGYNTIMIDEAVYPSASWLLKNDIDYETPMDQDLNGDGVSLETAEALGLDPNERLSGKLPKATINGNLLSIEFYASTPGYEYKVFTSTDLASWTETGVTISAPDAEGISTATTPATATQKFLRLTVGRETP